MADRDATSNPLVTTGKGHDTSINVQLHPLVLLTISDYITRHSIRQQRGPVIGAVLGQQNGRNITLEQAFQCKSADDDDTNKDAALLDSDWFLERLSQFKEVHKAPALDLVALFMLGPAAAGPQPAHRAVLRQVQDVTALDGTLLLLFHPEQVAGLQGGKLPISLYEALTEPDGGAAQGRFRELAFEVETGEAEMISVDFVAKGAANATAIAPSSSAEGSSSESWTLSKATEKRPKGKGRAKDRDSGEGASASLGTSGTSVLSAEDEELIALLTAKANAIKMLDDRLTLLCAYLQSLPWSYLTDATSTADPGEGVNYPLLRSMSALLSRLPLLAPPTPAPVVREGGHVALPASSALHDAKERERQDVHLTALLASLTRTIAEAQDLGAKLHTVRRENVGTDRVKRSVGRRGNMSGGGGRGAGGMDEGVVHEGARY